MAEIFKLAVCQMDSVNDKEKNLAFAREMIEEAAGEGAQMIAFPETMNYMGKGYKYQAESLEGETFTFLAAQAKAHRIWIMTGSIPVIHESGKPTNTLALISPEGKLICTYSKVHMFDVDIDDGASFQESAGNTAGDEIVTADTPFGKMGFSICYDLRFGEIYRLMALAGAKLIFVPSSFTAKTGAAHWEVLLRARAIENGIYIAAPAQTGHKAVSDAYGHALIIDPWGRILAEKKEGTGLIYAEIDPEMPEKIRRQIPSLKNRREDIYQLTTKEMKIYENANH